MSILLKQFHFEVDGVEYEAKYTKPGLTRASVCFLHDIGDHFGRYEYVADYLCKEGVAIYGADLPGHGKSPGIRGHVGPRQGVYRIIDKLYVHARRASPAPIFVMGHSMGGNIALSYRLRNTDMDIKGYIISSPWLKLQKKATLAQTFLLNAGAALFPSRAMDSGMTAEARSRTRETAENAKKDPLMHLLITPQTALDSSRAAGEILGKANTWLAPVYLFHGTKDRVCSVEGSRIFSRACPGCKYREWEGFGHDTMMENGRDNVLGGVCRWIAAMTEQ